MSRRPGWITASGLLLTLSGCNPLYFGYCLNPVVSAAQSRAYGGCYADCSPGWRCNGKTGYCEQVPPEPPPPVPLLDATADGGVP